VNILDKQHQAKLYGTLLVLYFILSSFNALWSSLNAALIACDWSSLTGQKKVQIIFSVAQNWSGVVVGTVLVSLKRMGRGQPPIETGDTDHRRRDE
jgi:uncharacterized membrane protein